MDREVDREVDGKSTKEVQRDEKPIDKEHVMDTERQNCNKELKGEGLDLGNSFSKRSTEMQRLTVDPSHVRRREKRCKREKKEDNPVVGIPSLSIPVFLFYFFQRNPAVSCYIWCCVYFCIMSCTNSLSA